ncbi:hypothetical protein D3C72_811690 [compost metagenome]
MCGGIVKLTTPAKGCGKTGIHPLQIGHALEDRQDIFSKRRTRRTRHHTRGNGYIAHQVPHGAYRFLHGCIIRRRTDHPGRIYFQGHTTIDYFGRNRTIRNIIVPAFIIGKGDGNITIHIGRNPTSAEHYQTAFIIGMHFSQVHRNALKFAVKFMTTVDVLSFHRTCAAINQQRFTIGHIDIAQHRSRCRSGIRDVQCHLELVPG